MPKSTKRPWTFLTNHAQVLLSVSNNGRITAREIAAAVGITERAVQRLLVDLEKSGYLQRYRQGRNNHYEVNLDRPLRHPAQRGQPVRDLFHLLLRYYSPSPDEALAEAGLGASSEVGGQGAATATDASASDNSTSPPSTTPHP